MDGKCDEILSRGKGTRPPSRNAQPRRKRLLDNARQCGKYTVVCESAKRIYCRKIDNACTHAPIDNMSELQAWKRASKHQSSTVGHGFSWPTGPIKLVSRGSVTTMAC